MGHWSVTATSQEDMASRACLVATLTATTEWSATAERVAAWEAAATTGAPPLAWGLWAEWGIQAALHTMDSSDRPPGRRAEPAAAAAGRAGFRRRRAVSAGAKAATKWEVSSR